MDIVKLQKFLRKNLGDITFREAYSKTRRVLNITISYPNLIGTSRLLNYLTSPDVLIWSAASASCALPGLFDPVELVEKSPDGIIVPYHPSTMKWSDGSVEQDLPITRLSELFNVNHFIVSQVNPHVVPFISSSRLPSNWIIEKTKNLLVSEIKHRIAQMEDLNLLPSFLVNLPGIVSQKYIGDITIVPNLTKSDYGNLLSNPTSEWIKECSIKTERLTWEQIPLIRTHCDIERSLDESIHYLRELLNKEPDLALDIFIKKI